ncbi:MAG: hypothetical protein R2941_21340 [Desulfobacterales bacterium]
MAIWYKFCKNLMLSFVLPDFTTKDTKMAQRSQKKLSLSVLYQFSIEKMLMKSLLSELLMHAECTDYKDFVRKKSDSND